MKATLSKTRLAGLMMMLCLSLLGCSQLADPSEEVSGASPEAAPEAAPEGSEESLEEARAEWEARQQHIASVLKTKDRAELIGNSPTKGSPDAEVVLFKFSDFQCPYCAVASADMKTFMDGREDVLYVYKHFPLNRIHPEATPSAKATWAAQQQDQFWLYHDGLFAYQDRLGEDFYVELAEQIGLDVEQFNRDRTSDEAAAAVEADLQLAQDLQIGGTPTFLMNDILVPGGAPLEFFEEAAVRIREFNATQSDEEQPDEQLPDEQLPDE